MHNSVVADAAPACGRLVAAVDIGTVTSRLMVTRALPDGRFDVLERDAVITDLGEGVDASGRLAPQAVERTLQTVGAYAGRVRACAERAGAPVATVCTTTSAARDAANADALLEGLVALGLDPQVIPGQTEAALALLGVTADFAPGRDVLVADVGGGSTELTHGGRDGQGRLVQLSGASYQVGCRRVTERFFAHGGPASPGEVAAARRFVEGEVARFYAQNAGAANGAELVCVGGTATSLVAIEHALAPYDPAFVHLRRMSREAVAALTERLLGMGLQERAALPGLQPKRAGVIAAGALIVDVLLELGGRDGFTASESDSLTGLLACARAAVEGAQAPIDWLPGVALLG